MDSNFKFPSSSGTPLYSVSPERVNIQRSSAIYDESSHTPTHSRDSSVVHEKVQVFNSLTTQGKQLERKTADAALKRAQLGREQAENEASQLRRELREHKHELGESQKRERKVAERLEAVIENYTKHKETFEHTKALWEKEIKRARKDSFKQQSSLVKLQEEVKSARAMMKIAQGELESEKGRSLNREHEAFAARYQLVGVQEELSKMQEQIKLVEQERDALRTIAKNEEIARIAAEGQIPLPACNDDDEFASPKKARKSLVPIVVTRFAASEEELDDVRMLLEWEQHRAKRAHDRVEFLEVECRLNCCSSRARLDHQPEKISIGRSSTVFIPSEGVFRTVSPTPEESPWISPEKKHVFEAPRVPERKYARTPSCEPPAPAIPHLDNRASLLSLLDAPQSPTPASSPIQESSSPSMITTSEESTLTNIVQTFHTISTTTRIPLAAAPDLTPITTLLPAAKVDALSPTMSREEALAQIRERRGRARSLAQGTMTPRKQMVDGANRRDISAPAIRSGGVRGRGVMKGI